ncbi:MAG: hypothetical protein KKC42_00795, partial [Candidatus Omnitrophica bacterium]|nr:hypothetical protein [Candidatus Omnitrophota bacterium]
NVSGEFYYHLGEDANFLYVDATNPSISKKIIKNIPIKNINATDTITITDLVLSWSFGGDINVVTLGGTSVWTGRASSPANINIADLAIASDAAYSNTDDQIWEFSRNVAGDLAVSFVFSDGSSYKTYLLKDGLGWDKAFSIKATGEIRSGAAVEARRTLLATYDIGTDNITSWEESQEHIIP